MITHQGISVEAPYVAVVFTNQRNSDFDEEYAATARRMEELVRLQTGYLGMESVRGEDGVGITISYWRDQDSARRWKEVAEHQAAQQAGRDRFYAWYRVRIARVESERGFGEPS